MAAPATPATPASYGDDFEDDFEPETPGAQAPAPAAAADDDLGDLLDAIIDAPDAAPEAAAAPEPEQAAAAPEPEPEATFQRQPSREAQEDFAAAVHPPKGGFSNLKQSVTSRRGAVNPESRAAPGDLSHRRDAPRRAKARSGAVTVASW